MITSEPKPKITILSEDQTTGKLKLILVVKVITISITKNWQTFICV